MTFSHPPVCKMSGESLNDLVLKQRDDDALPLIRGPVYSMTDTQSHSPLCKMSGESLNDLILKQRDDDVSPTQTQHAGHFIKHGIHCG